MIFFIFYFLIFIFNSSCSSDKIIKTDIKVYFSSLSKHPTIALSLDAVELLKNKKLSSYYEHQIDLFKKSLGLFPTFVQKGKLKNLMAIYDFVKKIEPTAFWYHLIPTTGLTEEPYNLNNLTYPFLPHAFSLHELAPKRGKGITIALLDRIPDEILSSGNSFKKKSKSSGVTFNPINSYSKSHGLHNAESAAGKFGIAPCADLIMINIFDNQNKSWPSLLTAGLKKAVLINADVVNISAKLTDYLDPLSDLSHTLEIYLNILPYVVVASGNSNKSQADLISVESYPARFDTIPFDVGSFGYESKNNTYPVSPFSQYEKTIGPKFLAPGEKILSRGIIEEFTNDEIYLLMDGTSMAAPLMSGFIALMLSEFKTDFSRKDLLKACYRSTVHLHNNNDWKVKTLLGVLDMRTVLFSLHCVRTLRQEGSLKNHSFDALFELVHNVLFGMVAEYSKKQLQNISFKDAFIDYFNVSKKITIKLPAYFYNLNDALNYVKKVILDGKYLMTLKQTSFPHRIEQLFTVSRQSSSLFVNNPSLYFSNETTIKNEIDNFIRKTQPLREYWKQQIDWV